MAASAHGRRRHCLMHHLCCHLLLLLQLLLLPPAMSHLPFASHPTSIIPAAAAASEAGGSSTVPLDPLQVPAVQQLMVGLNYSGPLECHVDGVGECADVEELYDMAPLLCCQRNKGSVKRITISLSNLGASDQVFSLPMTLPASISQLTTLTGLHIADMDVTNSLAPSFANLQLLAYLKLVVASFANKEAVQIFSIVTQLKRLRVFGTTNVNIAEEIPDTISNLASLEYFGITSASLSGSIPASIGKLTKLSLLVFSQTNYFDSLLGITGSLPAEIGTLTNLKQLQVVATRISGTIPDALSSLTNLQSSFDLSYNQLSGPIPLWLSTLTKLETIGLNNNRLTGSVPSFFGIRTFPFIQSLSLSSNPLTGVLPVNLSQLGEEIYLDLPPAIDLPAASPSSPSKLYCPATYSPCPTGLKRTGTFCATSCTKFCSTCGKTAPPPPPLPPSPPSPPPPPPSPPPSPPPASTSSGLSAGVITAIAVAAVVVVLLLLLCIWLFVSRRKSRRDAKKWEVDVENSLVRKFSLKELKAATDNFSKANKLGEGGFGAVYRGEGPGGEKWAVKRAKQPTSDFKTEIETVLLAMHPNLIRTIGYCSEGKEQLLVYELAECGNLKHAIHNATQPLTFLRRVEIAIGVASGLDYLHEGGEEALIHRDIKPENILLTKQLEAKIADFGLVKAVSREELHQTLKVQGTIGYICPEYYHTFSASPASDIYSFGVVLLELISARKAITFDDGKSGTDSDFAHIREWARAAKEASNDSVTPIIDKNLHGKAPREAFDDFVQLAFDCLQLPSHLRPSMSQVLVRLQGIKSLVLSSDLYLEENEDEIMKQSGALQRRQFPADVRLDIPSEKMSLTEEMSNISQSGTISVDDVTPRRPNSKDLAR